LTQNRTTERRRRKRRRRKRRRRRRKMTENTAESPKTYNSWKDLLKNVTVRELVLATHTKALIILEPIVTLRKAIEILANNKIISAPVVDPKTHVFHGMIDYLDIMNFIVSHWRKYSRTFSSEFFPSSEFFDLPITEVLNYSKMDFPVAIGDNASLEDLIHLFVSTRPSGRVHRVAVLQGVTTLWTVVSQSDLIKFLTKHLNLLKDGNKSVGGLGLPHTVIVAKAEDPACQVLEVMTDHLISGLALIDEKGHLVGQLSASDMRGLQPNSVDYFLMNAKQFSRSASVPKYVISCRNESLLKDVLKEFTTHRLHRIYVVTKEDYVTGIITLTDIIRYISQLE